MENKFLTLIVGALILSIMSFSFTACDNDHEAIYEGYGLVNKLTDNSFSVTLDDGNLIYPRETCINPSRLHDSTRLWMVFNILEESEQRTDIRLISADTILTKNVLPYAESILDSVGNDPIKINTAWFAHGFLNFEFVFAARNHPTSQSAHMVNLLQRPSENGKLIFEFRHNDFNDYRDQVYMGVVSFRMQEVIEDLEKPIKMEIRFNDSANTSRSIDLTYK